MRFGLIGAAGYVAPRHMRAIVENDQRLVVALDPSDSVGILDAYAPECLFFTDPERFDRHLDRARRQGKGVGCVSVCSPNWLHDAHAIMAMRAGADAIVEKPLVINPWGLERLRAAERSYAQRVWVIMQLRYHPAILGLREAMAGSGRKRHVELSYVTPRGPWYDVSWKGNQDKSGGLAVNLGVHLFDMLLWVFGSCRAISMESVTPRSMSGVLDLERADVHWSLSVDRDDLPFDSVSVWRMLAVGTEAVDFSGGFNDLHTKAYREILDGRGLGIDDAEPAIDLLHQIRESHSG